MKVCICKNISSHTINNAIHDGANNVAKIQAITGAATCCGKCTFKVQQLINDAKVSNTSSLPTRKTIFSLNNPIAAGNDLAVS